jgi:hypothetical protein
MIASCGLVCSDCEAYTATQAGDMEKLAKLAVKWGGDKNLSAEDMFCDGCTSTRPYKNTLNCVVRNCVQDKGIKMCSQCSDYACDKLEGLWKGYGLNVDQMKSNLTKAK